MVEKGVLELGVDRLEFLEGSSLSHDCDCWAGKVVVGFEVERLEVT
jgi:hypothetical protein